MLPEFTEIFQIPHQSLAKFQQLNDFQGGMAPKVAACLSAISSGATSVRIIDGNSAENLLLALAGTGGTLVHA
jgi:acetylglutamate kinase